MQRIIYVLMALAMFALLFAPSGEAYAQSFLSSAPANGIIYTNSNVGFSLTLPAPWAGRYSVIPSAAAVSFIAKESAAQTEGMGGLLFSIIRYDGKLTPEDAVVGSGERYLVAQTNDYSYVLAYPSDVEYTDATEKDYQNLAANIDAIGATVTTVPVAYISDPTYSAVGAVNENGLTDNYVYTFANGSVDVAPGNCLLMINGEFADAKMLIRNAHALAPVSVIQQTCGTVLWGYQASNGGIFPYSSGSGSSNMPLTIEIYNADENIDITMTVGQNQAKVNGKTETLDAAPVIENNTAYVPLRFICDITNVAIGYLPASQGVSTGYLADVSNRNAAKGLAYNPIVWVDDSEKTNDAKPTDATLAWLKEQMNLGLTSLKNNLDLVDGGLLKDTNPNDSSFLQIENAINNTYYIGNVGRYAMYQGPYITLVDVSSNRIYFYTIAHAMGAIWKANMSDPATFIPMYFAN